MTTHYAHSVEGEELADWELLEDHLRDVATLASEFARAFNASDWADALGWWHDVGKYSAEFQAYLLKANGFEAHLENVDSSARVDHSTAGAQHAASSIPVGGRLLAYCIAGHHAGLADAATSSGGSGLADRLKKEIPSFSDAPKAILNPRQLSNPALSLQHGCQKRASFQLSFLTRMLFSCLVDADFLATEAFMSPDRKARRPSAAATLSEMREALDQHLLSLSPSSETVVSRSRSEVLAACRAAAMKKPGLFSLTVPTGGGKTLSSLAFALMHAQKNQMPRVIYAIPFTSIIEQTASVFRNVFRELPEDSVLEHHSSVDPDRETVTSRLASENWDAPLIVTTTNTNSTPSLFQSSRYAV